MKPITQYTTKIKSYENLISLLRNNTSLNQLSEVNKNIALLEQNQVTLEKLNEYCVKDFSQILQEKDRNKNNLIAGSLKIGSLLVLASDNPKKIEKKIEKISILLGDISNKKLLKYTQKIISNAYKLLGNSFITESKWSFKKAKKNLQQADLIIENYGLTMEMVRELEETGMSFLRYIVTINAIKKKRGKAVEQISDIIEQNDKLLENSIDTVVNSMQSHDSEFYTKYFKVRNSANIENLSEVSQAQLS